MKARRMAYWWFRFVLSGRFLEKFLKLRRPWSHPVHASLTWQRRRAGWTAALRLAPARLPKSRGKPEWGTV